MSAVSSLLSGNLPMVVLAVAAGAGATAVALGVLALLSRRRCPVCDERFPAFRLPLDRRMAIWGGSVCRRCGAECDRGGNLISAVRKCPRCLYPLNERRVCPECGTFQRGIGSVTTPPDGGL